MTKLIIAVILVVAVVGGGLMALLRSRRLPLPSPEVLARVKERNRQLDVEESRERGD